ncbi:MAG: ribosome biogenesis GTP-binding protein YihA/YsxC [Oscillospiraceae bacterium]|nr:ribosome biogenesis GTP-binding protein YihA/YsxC [Oscillospiraceae bacterium]
MIDFEKVAFECAFGIESQLCLSDCDEIVFAGRSNVGKSSLLNKLFNRKKLARVSSMPGKTITINFYRVRDLRFVDLPGYGYAKVSKGEALRVGALVSGYFAEKRRIKTLFLLVDIRHTPSVEDKVMVNMLQELALPFVFVMTKADKLAKTKVNSQMAFVASSFRNCEGVECIPFSVVTGCGVERMKAIVKELEMS